MSNARPAFKNLEKSVTILGLGNIELPVAVLAALKGYKVFGVDLDLARIEMIVNLDENRIEPTISFFLQDAQVRTNLNLSDKITEQSDFFIICVQTSLKTDRSVCTRFVEAAIQDIIPFLKKGVVIILESSLPVGFTKKIAILLEKQTGMLPGRDFYLIYSPERLLPGQAFKELVFNDRILGGVTEACSKKAADFYLPIIKGNVFFTTAEAAELCKILENSFRAVQIALANEVDGICRSLNIDTLSLLELANKHPRVNFAMPGIGTGGDCIPVHPYFLQEAIGSMPKLIETALNINLEKTTQVVRSIMNSIDECIFVKKIKRPVVLVLGLTYKPNVNDLRNSPALKIAQELLLLKNIDLLVYDPIVDQKQKDKYGFQGLKAFYEYKVADILVFLVAHDKFAIFKETDLSDKVCIDHINFLKKHKILSVKNELASK